MVIEDASDLDQYLREGHKGLSTPRHTYDLNQPIPDRIVGRLESARRKHDVGKWTLNDYHRVCFFDDPIFHDISTLELAVSEAVLTFNGRLISYNHHTSHLSYFRALLPLIVSRCEGSQWIIIATGRVEESEIFTRVTRDYIDHDQFLITLSKIARVDVPSVESLIASLDDPRGNLARLPTNEMTLGEFEYALQEYRQSILSRLEAFIPLVPNPNSAPVEFIIDLGKIRVSDDPVKTALPASVVITIIEELIHHIDDVTRHFNLHNMAPACSAKLARVREHLVEIHENGVTEANAIGLGISTQATRDHLAYENDNIERPAEGAIRSALSQVEMFINRFREWRLYVQESEMQAPDPIDDSVLAAAALIMRTISERADIADEKTTFALNRSAYEARSTSNTQVERRGVLRILHNLTAQIFGYIKDIVQDSAASLKVKVAAAASAFVGTALWQLMSHLENAYQILAVGQPGMFAWVPHLIQWIRMVVGQ